VDVDSSLASEALKQAIVDEGYTVVA